MRARKKDHPDMAQKASTRASLALYSIRKTETERRQTETQKRRTETERDKDQDKDRQTKIDHIAMARRELVRAISRSFALSIFNSEDKQTD